MTGLQALRVHARYQTHAGYVWAAVTSDGACLCARCTRENYRQIYRSTRDQVADGWQVVGLTHSGEWDEPETCAHCGTELGV